MAHLSLTFFGGFQAVLDDRSITEFGSNKVRALLAFLAIENSQPHRRAALAGLFWPDLPEKKAAHNLSQTVLRLRNALSDAKLGSPSGGQPFLMINSQEIQLNPNSSIHSDVVVFRDLLKTSQQHHPRNTCAIANCPDCLVLLQKAAQLYCGDFLAGLYVRDSQPLEHWRLIQQESLQMQAAEVLERLTDHYERSGEYELMHSYSRRLTIVDPWSEEAHLKLMRALSARGLTAVALEHFEQFRHALADELGIEPSQAASNLYQQIRLGVVIPGSEISASDTEPVPSGQAELRQVTTIICGRCQQTHASDPEKQYHQMKGCRQACASVINRYGGYSALRQGNECLIYFGYPLAYEDSARRAVLAGLEMTSFNAQDPVRVSIHTGSMVVGEKRGRRSQDRELIGETPQLARDLQRIATPGSVVISENTEPLIRGWFDCKEPCASTEIEAGVTVTGYRLRKENIQQDPFDWLSRSSNLSQFTGRGEELELLCASMRQTANGKGHIVLVRGEAGIGKSRLVWELKQRSLLESTPGSPIPNWAAARCTQYNQNIPLFPLIRLIEQLLGVNPQDSQPAKNEKIVSALAQTFPHEPEYNRWLSLLLGIKEALAVPQPNAAHQREYMQTAVVALVKKKAAEQPLVLVMEDVQWSDADTIDWLTGFIKMLSEFPCLLLITARSTFDPPWLPKLCLTTIDLQPITTGYAYELAASIADLSATTSKQLRDVINMADGNPLYLEALVRSLPWDMASEVDLPPVLRDMMAARLDYLGPARATAQWAAAIGRTFPFSVLLSVSGMGSDRLRCDLQTLQEAGIIDALNAAPTTEYTFRHLLEQKAAYASLLKTTQRQCRDKIEAAMDQYQVAD